MKFIQCALLILLAFSLNVANAAAPKADCPKNKNKDNWNQDTREVISNKYTALWDGPKGREVIQPAPKATK